MPEALYGLGWRSTVSAGSTRRAPTPERSSSTSTYADAHFNLARVLTAQGKDDEAIKHYRAGLRLSPEDAEAQAAIRQLKTRN